MTTSIMCEVTLWREIESGKKKRWGKEREKLKVQTHYRTSAEAGTKKQKRKTTKKEKRKKYVWQKQRAVFFFSIPCRRRREKIAAKEKKHIFFSR